MITHSFDRFYVVIKFILPTLDDLKLSPINYDGESEYLENLNEDNNEEMKTCIKDLITYCVKLRPYMAFYKIQINTCNRTTHHILKNEVDLILPTFSGGRKSKRTFTTILSGIIGLAYEDISSFLHNRTHKALHKAVSTVTSKVDIQRNKHTHLENTMVMYGVHNVETLETLIKTVYALHSREFMYEKLFAGQLTQAYECYSQMHGDHGIHHYAINSMLYLRMTKDKYIEMYNKFISHLHN